MERIKTNGVISAAIITPGAHGWRLLISGGEDRVVETLEEAVAGVPLNAVLELSLPCQAVLLERHKLPATDREELGDMLQLQLEKTLPFPVEEVSSGFEVVTQSETESTILSVTAPHANLGQLCASLRSQGRLPERITLQALRVASQCNPEDITLAIWPEQDQLTAAIIEHGKLAWAQPLSADDVETLLAELPGMLLSVELEGISTAFNSIRVAEACSHLGAPLSEYFEQPVTLLSSDTTAVNSGLNLLPSAWRHEASRRERGEKLKQRLLTAAVVYLVVVAGLFLFLAWRKHQVSKVQRELVEMIPRYQGIAQQEERWKALAPSIEPRYYTAEVVHLLVRHCNPDLVQFTAFTFNPREWILHAEAKSSDEGFNFIQALKKDPDMELWQLPSASTKFDELKDGKVNFTVNGHPQ